MSATRTCIICGGPTGSREHIFPAALGGRRTNKGIYCGDHNNAYSGLAGIISEQLAVFNALLGVVGDHSTTPTSVIMKDAASGQNIELSSRRAQFREPQVRSEEMSGNQTLMTMAFSSRKEAEEWAAKKRREGLDIQFTGNGQKTRYYVGCTHKEIRLGGQSEGLRAIGYIAQTFFAHAFPEIARLPALQGIKDYTLNNAGIDLVWWDFEPPIDLPPNSFPFGHRVIVGLNAEAGIAYAHISFFSTLHFAIHIGDLSVTASRAVITDVNPLAHNPPDDTNVKTVNAAVGSVSKPDNLTAALTEAIHSGRAEKQISELLKRITDFERETAAAVLMRRINGAASLHDTERDTLFAGVVAGEAQRVFNLMTYIVGDWGQRANDPMRRNIADRLEQMIKLDPSAKNGLSADASDALQIACDALAKQMSMDCKAGILDQDRMSMLIGGGPGAGVVAQSLFDRIMAT